jgi:hypothetical protein
MTKPIHEMSSWNLSGHSRTPEEEQAAWQATRQVGGAATQMIGDEEDYLAAGARDVGRHLGNGQWELFVVCDPGEAMHLQFDHLKPDYIAIHDVGTSSSRRLLAGLAAATQNTVQKLVIRRQGAGVALATLEFVELATGDAKPLRLYTTEADADTAQRRELARVLLAHSRLGVVMVGDLPPHALEPALQPLRDAIAAGPWPNRHLLLLPLSSAGAVTAHATQIGRGSGVSVRTTPQVTRPADAWNFIVGTWNKLREHAAATGTELPMLSAGGRATSPKTPTAPPTASAPSLSSAAGGPFIGLQPMPPSAPVSPVPSAPAPPAVTVTMARAPGGPVTEPAPLTFTAEFAGSPAFAAPPTAPQATTARAAAPVVSPDVVRPGAEAAPPALAAYARRVAEIKGMVSCCLFDTATQRPVAHAGTRPGPASLASQGADLFAAMVNASKLMGLGDAAPDAAVTLASHHLLLRPLPHHPGLALHAVLDRGTANLTLVRLQLQRLDETLDEA